MATRAIYSFCTVTLSARYFDIIKDRLYTSAPRSTARRSAQTALFKIAAALARLLSPILVFTADEIWENLPADDTRPPFVHLGLLPDKSSGRADALMADWEKLFEVRDEVLQTLEEARIAKTIGSSLEARVQVAAGGPLFELLNKFREELRYLFIVSQVELQELPATDSPMKVEVGRASGKKCERCWNYSERVGESDRYPEVCERCLIALEEIESPSAGS